MVPLLSKPKYNRKISSHERWFIPNTLCTVKNPIAPEPKYASHYYYYSTRITVSKETSVRREGRRTLEIHLSLYSPFNISVPKGIPNYVRQVMKKMSNQVPSEINTLAHILLSDFQIL